MKESKRIFEWLSTENINLFDYQWETVFSVPSYLFYPSEIGYNIVHNIFKITK